MVAAVCTDETTCCTKVNDSSGGRRNLTKSMNMSHNIMTTISPCSNPTKERPINRPTGVTGVGTAVFFPPAQQSSNPPS